MRTENEIKQKLNEINEKKLKAKMMKHTFLETYFEGLIDGLRWVMQGDKNEYA